MQRRSVAAAAAVALLIGVVPAADAAQSTGVPTVKRYANCKALNKVYPHGVGKPGAKDKVRKGAKPVTNFKRSKRIYKAQPRTLDRDRDGIACEKR
jgi:hypothetical protein